MSLKNGAGIHVGPLWWAGVTPTRCPRSDPETHECLIFHGKRNFADVIKSRTSRWRKCSGLFRWPNQNMDSVQLSSVPQSCPTLCSPMDCSAPGLPVHHQLPEFTQTHVCWVSDVIPTISSSVVPFSSCLPSTFSNCAQRRRDYSRRLVTEMQHHWLQRWSKRTTSRGKWAPLGPEMGEETKVLPWSLQTGTSPANTLTLDLYFAELCNNIFLWS